MRQILLLLLFYLFVIGNQLWGQAKPIVANDKTAVPGHFDSASSGETVAITVLNIHEAIPVTGGSATGSNGSSTYSLGQLVDTYNIEKNGSVDQGIQQAFEISVLSGVEETSITLQCSVYPNPSTDIISLNIDKTNLQKASYQLYDINGKLIEMKDITTGETSIAMSQYLPSCYFLKVMSSNRIIKSFKIIKK